ncbi:MAG: phycobiliprotein lyase [Cyanobacteriota bacterium]|nr:phycobiliprotein lyase [Cyanobacteriota bacterium]
MTAALDRFHYFFDCCIGGWKTERTYHDMPRQTVERSHTTFTIRTLTPAFKDKVLHDNHYPSQPEINGLLGFHLGFETVSEFGDEVAQELNMLFLPQREVEGSLEGDYLRDRAYQEDRPIVAHFRFEPEGLRLLMTTTYTQMVAVDSITLINPRLRIRQILTYQRPQSGQPLQEVILVGFGVEQKVT